MRATTTRAVTVVEFSLLVRERLVNSRMPIPLTDLREFLDRCCDLGLLTCKRDGRGITRYAPTLDLARCLPREDDE